MSQQLLRLFIIIIFEPFQFALRACHRTETALTKVVKGLLTMESDSIMVLLLLDLSVAFDTIVLYVVPD